MKTVALILVLACAAAGHDSGCSPPPAVVARLAVVFRYENGLGSNEPHQERFSFTKVGDRSYLRQNTVPRYYDPMLRPVWIFDASAEVSGPGANCPLDPSWIDCAVYLGKHANEPLPVVQGNEELHYPAAGGHAPVCEFTLDVPKWEPSPDSPEKRTVASELLSEFKSFGYGDAREIVIRDFNLGDPEITAYITEADGTHQFQGCGFTRNHTPHCSWHMFGQAPISSLRKQVMSRPYRLYPPLRIKR